MNTTNTIWHSGLPKNKGIYWFDSGLSKKFFYTDDLPPFLLKIGSSGIDDAFLVGPGGNTLPLSMVLLPRHKITSYAMIEPPTKWHSLSIVSDERSYGWFKDPNGKIGIAHLHCEYHSNVYGDWLWLEGGSEHGDAYRRFDEGFEFCPIKVPRRW